MYCIYCGEELKHHKEISDNLFECVMCEKIFEIYPMMEVSEEFEKELETIEEILQGSSELIMIDELVEPPSGIVNS